MRCDWVQSSLSSLPGALLLNILRCNIIGSLEISQTRVPYYQHNVLEFHHVASVLWHPPLPLCYHLGDTMRHHVHVASHFSDAIGRLQMPLVAFSFLRISFWPSFYRSTNMHLSVDRCIPACWHRLCIANSIHPLPPPLPSFYQCILSMHQYALIHASILLPPTMIHPRWQSRHLFPSI